ncbi:MAG: hypothetical protein ACJAR6_000147 [Oleispira sp.]|jgi:hypothetical protein
MLPKFNRENINIRGVKVSDEINLELAQLKCISSIARTKKIAINNTEDYGPESLESSNIFSDHSVNDAVTHIENLTKDDTVSNTITLEMKETNNLPTGIYSSTCLESERCKTLNSFQQYSLLKTKDHLSTTVEYSTPGNTQAQITLIMNVK